MQREAETSGEKRGKVKSNALLASLALGDERKSRDSPPPLETPSSSHSSLSLFFSFALPFLLLRSPFSSPSLSLFFSFALSISLSTSPSLPSLSFSSLSQQQQQAWLDGRHAVVGTKCNQLLLLDVDARSGTRVALPPAHARQPRPAGMDSPGHGVFNASGPKGSGMHTTAVSPDGRLLACGGSDATDAQIFRIERG